MLTSNPCGIRLEWLSSLHAMLFADFLSLLQLSTGKAVPLKYILEQRLSYNIVSPKQRGICDEAAQKADVRGFLSVLTQTERNLVSGPSLGVFAACIFLRRAALAGLPPRTCQTPGSASAAFLHRRWELRICVHDEHKGMCQFTCVLTKPAHLSCIRKLLYL